MVAKPLYPLYKNIIKPLDRVRYPELRYIIDHWVEKMLDHLAKLPDVRFLSSEEREKYDESIKAVDDYYSGLYGSYVEGEKKGIAKGMAKEKIDTAYRLLSMGMSWSQIMQATGLTEEELKPLQA